MITNRQKVSNRVSISGIAEIRYDLIARFTPSVRDLLYPYYTLARKEGREL